VLGVLVLALPPKTWLAGVQVGAVAGFTVILAALDPMLLVHPFGMLTKNLPSSRWWWRRGSPRAKASRRARGGPCASVWRSSG
jgi:hypothetical protein